MPESNLHVKMTGDARGLNRAQNQGVAGTKKIAGAQKGVTKESGKANRELIKFADKMARLNTSPLERAKDRMGKLNNATVKTRLGQEKYNRAVQHTVSQLAKQTGVSKKAAAAQLGVHQSFVKSKSSLHKYAGAAKGAFKSVATAVAATAAAAATKIISEADRMTKEAGKAVQAMAKGTGELSQMASTDADAARLRKQWQKFFLGGATRGEGAAGVSEAIATTMQLESAGQLDELKFFTQIGASGLFKSDQIGELGKSVNALQSSLGLEETGGARDVVSKALVASEINPENVPALLQATAGVASMGKALGQTDESLLSAVSIAAGPAGTAAKGGTQVQAFLKALAKQDLERWKGKQIPEIVQELQTMKLSPEETADLRIKAAKAQETITKLTGRERTEVEQAELEKAQAVLPKTRKAIESGFSEAKFIEYFGRLEGFGGFMALSQRFGELSKRTQMVDVAASKDVAGERIQRAMKAPEVWSSNLRRQELAEETLSNMQEGVADTLADAYQSNRVKSARRKHGRFAAAGVSAADKVYRFFAGPENYLANVGMSGESERGEKLLRRAASIGIDRTAAAGAMTREIMLDKKEVGFSTGKTVELDVKRYEPFAKQDNRDVVTAVDKQTAATEKQTAVLQTLLPQALQPNVEKQFGAPSQRNAQLQEAGVE